MSGVRTAVVALIALGLGFVLGGWLHPERSDARSIHTGGHVSSLPDETAPAVSESDAELERLSVEELRVRYRELAAREQRLRQQLALPAGNRN